MLARIALDIQQKPVLPEGESERFALKILSFVEKLGTAETCTAHVIERGKSISEAVILREHPGLSFLQEKLKAKLEVELSGMARTISTALSDKLYPFDVWCHNFDLSIRDVERFNSNVLLVKQQVELAHYFNKK